MKFFLLVLVVNVIFFANCVGFNKSVVRYSEIGNYLLVNKNTDTLSFYFYYLGSSFYSSLTYSLKIRERHHQQHCYLKFINANDRSSNEELTLIINKPFYYSRLAITKEIKDDAKFWYRDFLCKHEIPFGTEQDLINKLKARPKRR